MHSARNLPDPKVYDYVVAGNSLRMSPTDIRKTGALVPEIFAFPPRRQIALLNTRKILAVPKAARGGDPAFVKKALSYLSNKNLGEMAAFLDLPEEEFAGTKDERIDLLLRASGFNIPPPAKEDAPADA